jgi:hypothetical protein
LQTHFGSLRYTTFDQYLHQVLEAILKDDFDNSKEVVIVDASMRSNASALKVNEESIILNIKFAIIVRICSTG